MDGFFRFLTTVVERVFRPESVPLAFITLAGLILVPSLLDHLISIVNEFLETSFPKSDSPNTVAIVAGFASMGLAFLTHVQTEKLRLRGQMATQRETDMHPVTSRSISIPHDPYARFYEAAHSFDAVLHAHERLDLGWQYYAGICTAVFVTLSGVLLLANVALEMPPWVFSALLVSAVLLPPIGWRLAAPHLEAAGLKRGESGDHPDIDAAMKRVYAAAEPVTQSRADVRRICEYLRQVNWRSGTTAGALVRELRLEPDPQNSPNR